MALDCEKKTYELVCNNRTPVTWMRNHIRSHVKTCTNKKRNQEEMMNGCVSSHVDGNDCKSIMDVDEVVI